MNKENLLIEIGVEEIPADSIGIAISFIRDSFEAFILESGLSCGRIDVFSTPRRLAIRAIDLDSQQEDKTVTKSGPAVSIAYNAEGELSPAGLGFLKKCGAKAEDIIREESEKGSFISIKQEIKGRNTADLIADWFSGMIKAIPFPKKMIWNQSKGGFIRPLRWLVGLFGNELLKLDAFGIASDRISFGNRWTGLDTPVMIQAPDEYEGKLMASMVMCDREARLQSIREQLDRSFQGKDCSVLVDNRLVETVTDLVEYPTAVVAEFDEAFLSLPDKIITSTISQNQKYFSVVDAQGSLTNRFVFISNGDPRHSGLIRKGNEKVVRARLADAMWYFREDLETPLENYYPKLKDVVFHAKLGTVADKTNRIMILAEIISDSLGFAPEQKSRILRAGLLCKTDLVTTMLGEKEFTKLQGYIGKQYALAGGEDPEVAEAINEHYMPKGQADKLPETVSGAVIAIADKLDTVCGIIGIGMLPTGSGDPFALRRAAGGIVQILADRGWNLDLKTLIETAIGCFEENPNIKPNSFGQILSFFASRVKWLLQQYNISYDVIESVMHTDTAHIPDIRHRAQALQDYRNHEDFIGLVIGFKRVANIISAEKSFGEVDVNLLSDPAELALYDGLSNLHRDIDSSLERSDYEKTISYLVRFGVEIDRFFDDVLVNTEDAAIRTNRYSLLYSVKQEFLRVADLSLLVIE